MTTGRTVSASRYVLSLLRFVVAFLFIEHGLQKMFGLLGGFGGPGHTAHFFSLFWCAGIIECVGGFLLFFGLFTRPVAFILCGEMAVAYFHAHFPRSPWPIISHGELPALYCFIFLYLLFAGPGPVSLDRLFRKKV
ncbi:MAG TPA: DoxX family protein [Bryobacteraceae bacterium]